MKYDRVIVHKYGSTEPRSGTDAVSPDRAPCLKACELVTPLGWAVGKQQNPKASARQSLRVLVHEKTLSTQELGARCWSELRKLNQTSVTDSLT